MVADNARRAALGIPAQPAGVTDKLAARLGGADAFAVLVEDGGELVSCAMAVPGRQDFGTGGPIPGLVHITTVATRVGRWGRGYGTAAMTAVMAEARSRGYRRAQLWTHVTNDRARRLYDGTGWIDSGERQTDDLGEIIGRYERGL